MNEYWAEFDARLARLVALRDEYAAYLIELEAIPDVSGDFYWKMLHVCGAIEAAVADAQAARQPDDAA